VTRLREWQQRAIDTFYGRNATDFTVSATPGSGKTRLALTLAKRQIEEGAANWVVVVVPTDALREQWQQVAGSQFNLSLKAVSQAADYGKAGYVGCVVTYAQLARGAGADLLRRVVASHRTFAVLDEIHHAGENRSWGDGLTYALDHAVTRLALTGTPWRKDKDAPIPFVSYDRNGQVHVDAEYEYGTAVADGVCRGVIFDAYEGEARWVDCGKISTANLGDDLADGDIAAALDTVLHPDHEWIPGLLAEAVSALNEIREDVPDAAGLVVADSQWHARSYADLLTRITGVRPVLAVSDDPGAKDSIERFRDSSDRWLVAVKMVSEGVDIPRLAVGVYGSKIKTPLFFRQVVGRFVRSRPGEELTARLFIPAVPPLMVHAKEIENELRHQLDLETERDEKARAEALNEQRTFELREPLSASSAIFDQSIFGGEVATQLELDQAREECRRCGIPTRYATEMARSIRERGGVGLAFEVKVTPPAPAEPRFRRERVLRAEVDRLTKAYARRSGVEPREVNVDLLRGGFPRRADASVEELEDMRDFLVKKLGDL
jgi:superfamily II DNA or RNA helicase